MVVKRGLSQSVLQIKTKYSGVLLFIVYFVYLFPPFIYFTSNLYCITRFEDEDAICRINIRLQE